MRWLCMLMMFLGLNACNNGDGYVPYTPTPEPTVVKRKILPLNVTMLTLDNQSLSEINVYKIDSNYHYKLTFTNPNPFAVSIPTTDFKSVVADVSWYEAHHPGASIPAAFYGSLDSLYAKTDNSDDCINLKELAASGGHCSFYTTAFYTLNTESEEHLQFPLSYRISPIGESDNILTVEQCQLHKELDKRYYDCSNESMPGYANQFIHYTLVPTTNKYTPPGDADQERYSLTYISGDGHTAVACGIEDSTCIIKKVLYDANTNTLAYQDESKVTFGAFNTLTILPILPYNGSSVWGATLFSGLQYFVYNSVIDSREFVGALASNWSFMYFVNGVDGSFWCVFNRFADSPKIVKYVPGEQGDLTRIDSLNFVYGVTRDGVVIAADSNFNLVCADSNDGINYTMRPMANFKAPTTYEDYIFDNGAGNEIRALQVHDQFYGYMDYDYYDVLGEQKKEWGVYYKITADKDHCSIDPGAPIFDYFPAAADDYVLIGWDGYIAPASASAVGYD